MPNATYLTEKYPGVEKELWTPCIYTFLIIYKPVLPVSVCIEHASATGPWFEARKQSPDLRTIGKLLKEPPPEGYLPPISSMFNLDLERHPGRYNAEGNDIAGIAPDMVLIKPNREGVTILENKPYYCESTLEALTFNA
jgi:hypothetical protein